MIRRFWAWYKRIGPPIEFYTALSPEECRKRLRSAASDWDIPYQITAKLYKAKLHADGTFLLQQRLGFSVRARRPFVGKLEATSGGGTKVSGHIENSTSFLGFATFLLVAAPLVMGYFHGTTGSAAAVLVVGLLIFAALFAHHLERDSTDSHGIRQWLYQVLDGDTMIIQAPKILYLP
ncbi:MAG: hypothetical protein KJ064_22975 [Anaerolineae bacterium]|nr:hypothetical protein [Anaerolineae bacterium]